MVECLISWFAIIYIFLLHEVVHARHSLVAGPVIVCTETSHAVGARMHPIHCSYVAWAQ